MKIGVLPGATNADSGRLVAAAWRVEQVRRKRSDLALLLKVGAAVLVSGD